MFINDPATIKDEAKCHILISFAKLNRLVRCSIIHWAENPQYEANEPFPILKKLREQAFYLDANQHIFSQDY